MQDVYLANDTSLDRPVVVKIPKDGLADRRFRRGAEVSARINHPNIASTFDYFEDSAMTFVVEEYIPGRDLRAVMKDRYYFLDPSLAARAIHQLARALSVAHAAGIVHRDIKPSNVMVVDEVSFSSVKLTDFGIAKLAEAQLAE